MSYDYSEEAKKIVSMAKDDLKNPSAESGAALLREIQSIPREELSSVQRSLRDIGNLDNPNSPEVMIKTREGMEVSIINGRQKWVEQDSAVGIDTSGEYYTSRFSWNTQDSSRKIREGQAAETNLHKLELFDR